MGNYNPHAPYIIGQEWVPILNAPFASDGVVERGYTFTLEHTHTPVSGAFYVQEIPENRLASSCDFISVYPAGRETLSGPIRKVNIPASAVTVNNPGSIDISAGVSALFNPEDTQYITFAADTGIFSQLRVSFDTSSYAELLLGKRILDVRLRYSLSSFNIGNAANFAFEIEDTAFSTATFQQTTEITDFTDVSKISVLSITEMNPFWDSATPARGQRTVLPWRFQELNRFRSGASPALVVSLQNNAVEFTVALGFMDLEVIYCEETRVLYGGFKTYDTLVSNSPVVPIEFYNIGAIAARLYNPVTFTQGNTLPPGDYTVTIYHRDLAARSIYQGTPKLYAVRQYYELPNQRGINVRQTFTVDDQFTSETSETLTHLTLHTASTIVTGVHAYGTQFGAPIYGSRTAIQEIEDNPAGGTTPYPQVRFYARRFGNTTIPLTLVDVATGLSTVSISPADFDDLEEIVDGWREVNLRFATPPTFPVTADDVDWRWQASGELVGNQWQVMVASGPTGAWQPNPTAASTGPATYWAPLGSTVALTWQSPTISGSAADVTSDAVLIFSQDPPAVTGFALTSGALPVTTALRCLTPPACIPTGIAYNHLTWTYGGLMCDSFDDRDTTATGGWGTPDFGPGWVTLSGGTDVFVANDTAHMVFPTSGMLRQMQMPVSTVNFDVIVEGITWPIMPAGATPTQAIRGRYVDNNNMLEAEIFRGTLNDITVRLISRTGGVETDTGFILLPNTVSTQTLSVRFQAIGTVMRAKFWPTGQAQPNSWFLSMTATQLNTGVFQYYTEFGALTATYPFESTTDSFTILLGPQYVDTSIEIQRRDTVDTTWQTVVQTSSPCMNTFNDYEARVGVRSDYRIRTLNALDFAGPWVTGSATLPSPGVQGVGGANSVLIFTSNADTAASLAYVMQFEGQPIEEFSFPEADTVTLQRLFGRDFVIATRPLERGGERFSRTLLVNAAAISLPSLANFRSLRDLAWEDLDYVCVRDELGNRWFATVIVPQGEVRGNRTIYLARVDVIEVTDTPSPVES